MTLAARAMALRVAIRYLKAEVSVVLKHQGNILPAPSAQPMTISLESVIDDQLGFIMLFAVPQASTIKSKPGELRLTFNRAWAAAEHGLGSSARLSNQAPNLPACCQSFNATSNPINANTSPRPKPGWLVACASPGHCQIVGNPRQGNLRGALLIQGLAHGS
jgi:hypothetical protein